MEQQARRGVAVSAPAKVNLQLSVGAVQEDGFHPLATVFQAVSLRDTVVVLPRDDEQITVAVEASPHLSFDSSTVPIDDTNVAWRAAQTIREHYNVSQGVDLTIVKGIPVAAGMAGGSADAAAALRACVELWGIEASREDLLMLGAGLGADVPFCLHGHTAVGRGRGDLLTSVMVGGEFHWVFATQSSGLSTPSVYAEFDRQVRNDDRVVAEPQIHEPLIAALRTGDAEDVARYLSNDLQEAACTKAPHVADTLAAAMEAGALGALVSGSGPTVAALARSRQHALAVSAGMRASGTADHVLVATGPVNGATVTAHG